MKKFLKSACVAGALVLAMAAGAAATEVGKPVADFSAPQVFTGTPITKESFKGKPVVIAFFNTRCSACESEIKTLGVLREKNMGKFDILLGCTDFVTPKFADTMNEYMTRMNLSNYTIVSDPKLELAEKFGFTFTPSTVGIGKDGKISFLMSGFGRRDPAVLDENIKKLIGN